MVNSAPDDRPTTLGIPALDHLAPNHRAVLTELAERREFDAGSILYDEGDRDGGFLFIAEGMVEARRHTPFGEQRVATLGPGDLVGEMSLLDGKPRSSKVIALRDGAAWRFASGPMTEATTEDPTLEVALLRMFSRSLVAKIRQAHGVMHQIMAPGTAPENRGGNGAAGAEGSVDAETRKRLLERQGMRADDLARLASFVEARRFAAGEHVFSEGDPSDTLYLVAEGEVRISRHIPGLGPEALAILEQGELFGEMAWIDQKPRSADAIAHVGGCTVLAIGRELLEGTIGASTASQAEFFRALSTVLCRRLRAMNDQLVAYRTIAWY